MNILSISCHPEPKSLTRTVLATFCDEVVKHHSGAQIDAIDLVDDKFAPTFSLEDQTIYRRKSNAVPDYIKEYQARFDSANAIVISAPMYWWSFPATLKGWFDRVFIGGWAFDGGDTGVIPLLADRPVSVMMMCGSDETGLIKHGYDVAFETQVNGGLFGFCGIKDVEIDYFSSAYDETLGGTPFEEHIEKARKLGQSMVSRLYASEG